MGQSLILASEMTSIDSPAASTYSPLAARDQMGGLVKGIRLVEAFDSAHTRMTLTEAARRTGITSAAARRCLLTLCELGYVQTDGKFFWMGHGALRFAYAYAASTRLPRLVQPILDAMCERTRESATLSVLDLDTAIITARSSSKRTMRVGLGVGARMPLYCSATGRALLSGMMRASWVQVIQRKTIEKLTPHTETTIEGLWRQVKLCQENGYALCDQEVELGVRSIAVPLHDRSGNTIAAVSIASRAERMTCTELVFDCLPSLRRCQAWARENF